MRLLYGTLILSATDLTKFIRCEHVTTLDLGYTLGTLTPLAHKQKGLHAELLARKGSEHEARFIDELGARVVRIEGTPDVEEAARKTLDAMRAGAEYIHQGVVFNGRWIGYIDLLEKVAIPSNLGGWSYEVADTKLARSVKPHFILQLALYSDEIGRIQGRPPTHMHVILGTGERVTLRCADFDAYYRHVRSRLERRVNDSAATTRAYPVEFCDLCEWRMHCWRDWVANDHLSLVANIRRTHVRHLESSQIPTLTRLGESPDARVPEIPSQTYATLHHQARLQLEHRRTGRHRYELLGLEEKRGLQQLPQSSPGDLFLDLEADPYAEGGIHFLFGVAWLEGGSPVYRALWAHDAAAERKSFEEVMELLAERRRAHPEMHIYHYGALDRSALKVMSSRYGSREREIDQLLREDAFVDLLTVVRQALRISHAGYGLKKVETFYFDREEEGVFEAGGPILAYEDWLETSDPAMLQTIEAYNREDCLSTIDLRNWLLKLRDEAKGQFGTPLHWRIPPELKPRKEEALEAEAQSDELSRALLETTCDMWGAGGSPAGPRAARPRVGECAHPECQAAWLLAHLLHYHRREARPGWWWFFNRLDMTPQELLEEDHESIGCLSPHPEIAPQREDRSLVYTLTFPIQDHKLAPGDRPRDPSTRSGAGTIVSIDNLAGILQLKRGTQRATDPLPKALIPEPPLEDEDLRAALRRVAQHFLASGFDGEPYRAIADNLLVRTPRLRNIRSGDPLHGAHVDEARVKALVSSLDHSYLFIQGPPGSGKTYHGARAVVDLLRQGKRVGVSSNSHKAIHNLLDEIEKVATNERVPFRGLKRCSSEDTEYHSASGAPAAPPAIEPHSNSMIANSYDDADFLDPSIQLLAGTAWLFADARLDQSLDYVFIDEAGQVSLANALAIATAARNVILLGDPLQLAQVSQGVHPTILAHEATSEASSSCHPEPFDGACPERAKRVEWAQDKLREGPGREGGAPTLSCHPERSEGPGRVSGAKDVGSNPPESTSRTKIAPPLDAGASILQHLLGDAPTIPPSRGVFLEQTHRMHPDVTRFISEVVYDGRLESAPGRERQTVTSRGLSGTGLRYIPIEHQGNSTSSPEEAERIANEIRELLDCGTVTDHKANTRALRADDLMVVAPYNAQVRCVSEVLRIAGLGDVPVGTVDKFQGRQAEVVFFTMATSSGDELPRNIEFLFSRNRLNVAISRAKCLAVLVASPRLLDVSCRTPEQMQLVNSLCRFAEVAAPLS